MTYLVDTNAISGMIKALPALAERVAAVQRAGDRIVYSVVSHGEIHYGLARMPVGERRARLTQALWLVLSALGAPVPVDEAAAMHYAEIKTQLERQGTSIPDNDSWMASIARSGSYVLITADAHFEDIAGLAVENWLK